MAGRRHRPSELPINAIRNTATSKRARTIIRNDLALATDGTVYASGTGLHVAAPGQAPRGLDATGNPVFCTLWTYLGLPAVSLPLLQGGDGLPIGVQLVGARGDDARLLRTARWLVESLRSKDQG